MNDWWEKATGEEYIRRAKCIVDQYSDRYNEQTGLYLKGKQNQGENIADNGGIKESYMAYSKFSFGIQAQWRKSTNDNNRLLVILVAFLIGLWPDREQELHWK